MGSPVEPEVKTIVNTSSVMGLVGSPTSPAYSAAKGAITLFTKSAALQYAKDQIRVNSVHPGFIETPMTAAMPASAQAVMTANPLGRAGQPADIAGAVAFLCSDDAAFITGHLLDVNGGHDM